MELKDLKPNSRRYLETYTLWNSYLIDQIFMSGTKQEKRPYKDQLIKDIKKQNYPKIPTKEIIKYIRSL